MPRTSSAPSAFPLRPQRSNSKKYQSNLRTSREEIHHTQFPFCLESALRPLRSLCALSIQTLKNPNQTSREKIHQTQLPFCLESALRPLRSLCALSVQTLKNPNQTSREKIYHNQLPFCRESALRPLRSLCALSVQTLKNPNQPFFTNSVLSTKPFTLSALPSISFSSSVNRICFTIVPRLSVTVVPFTLRSLIKIRYRRRLIRCY